MADAQIHDLPITHATAADADLVPVSKATVTGKMTLGALVARAINALLTGYQAGANAAVAAGDTILQAIGKLQGQITALVPPLAVEETGTAWNITETGHAYREVTGTNAAAITATFNFAAMVANRSWGIVRQGGAGVITLAGATVVYAPHLSATQGNSPTTGSARGWLQWVFRGGSTVEIVARSEDQAGNGGGSITMFSATAAMSVGTADTEETLATINLGALAAGATVDVKVIGLFPDALAGTGMFRVRLGASQIGEIAWPGTGTPQRSRSVQVFSVSPTVQWNTMDGDAQGVDATWGTTAVNTSAGATITIIGNRWGANLARVVNLQVYVKVTRP